MAVSTALLYTFLVFMVVIIAFGILGNLLVPLATLLCPSLRKRENIPLASLSVSDLLFTALHPPMWIVALLNPEFRLPWGLCVLQSYLTPVLWGVSVCHMGCIAVYRLFRVLYRYRFPAMTSTKAVCIEVAMAWLIPFLSFILIHLHPSRDVMYDHKLKRCGVIKTSSKLAKVIAGLPVICPYFVGLACYIAIWLALRKSNGTMLEHNRRKAAAPKIKVKTSSDTQGGSSSHRVSVVLEKEGSSGRGSMVVTSNTSVSRDDVENLPGVPEHSTMIMTKCSWSKCQEDSGEPSELDKADQPQASDTPSAEDNISFSASATGDKITSTSLGGGKGWASKKTPSPSKRQLEVGRESSGKKTRKTRVRKAYIHEEQDSDLSTTGGNLPNTTVHDLSTTISVSRSSFNRAVGNIAWERKKPRLRLSSAEKEMLKMMVAVFINYALCNLPMTVMAVAEDGNVVPEEAFLVGMLLWAANAAMNPIIYGLMNTRFKQGYRDIWARFTRLWR